MHAESKFHIIYDLIDKVSMEEVYNQFCTNFIFPSAVYGTLDHDKRQDHMFQLELPFPRFCTKSRPFAEEFRSTRQNVCRAAEKKWRQSLGKFIDNTKLGVLCCPSQGPREPQEKGRAEPFEIQKCRVLHLGKNNPGHQHGGERGQAGVVEEKRYECDLLENRNEGPGGPGGQTAVPEPGECPGDKEANGILECTWKGTASGSGSDPAPLPSPGWHLWNAVSALGSSGQEGHRAPGEGPAKAVRLVRKGLEPLPHEERLRELGLSLEKRQQEIGPDDFHKFIDNTKLGVLCCPSQGPREPQEKGRAEPFEIQKCRVLHLGKNNPGHQHGGERGQAGVVEEKRYECDLLENRNEGPGGPGGQTAVPEPGECPGDKEANGILECTWKGTASGSGSDPAPLPSPGWHLWNAVSALGSSGQEGHRAPGEGPAKAVRLVRKGLEPLPHEERLRELGLSLEKRQQEIGPDDFQ
ncbi:hypothetical protein HGM15179_014701 [Zosterops borbonicus]|uniref:Uncharacterized protein n=1 Tax=Zosterops borbonicus TaxID=364589 RepID=A0A8K1G695_9PASS|nr:hypothetical protein HGM15179_014701 [Zosterops borbonicus]